MPKPDLVEQIARLSDCSGVKSSVKSQSMNGLSSFGTDAMPFQKLKRSQVCADMHKTNCSSLSQGGKSFIAVSLSDCAGCAQRIYLQAAYCAECKPASLRWHECRSMDCMHGSQPVNRFQMARARERRNKSRLLTEAASRTGSERILCHCPEALTSMQ